VPRTLHVERFVAALAFALALAGCATLDRSVPRVVSHAWPAPEDTALGRLVPDASGAPERRSGFHLVASGMEAFALRAALAEVAQRTVDLQYYAVHDDATGQLLLNRLLAAAKRGVRVRLLIDDFHIAGDERQLAILAAHPNVEVRVYNPFVYRAPPLIARVLEYATDPVRLNRRMHNKAWIADNAAAIVGGRNVGDEYFEAHAGVNFTDLDLLAIGPVVREISESFDAYWNSEWSMPIAAFVASAPTPEDVAGFARRLGARMEVFRDTEYARILRDTAPGARLRSGSLTFVRAHAAVIYDEPGKAASGGADSGHPQFAPRVQPLVEAARREVLLISPYFIPSEIVLRHLAGITRRGVKVRILTNSLASTDAPVVHAAYARARPRLLAAGVELYEMRPDRLRASARSGDSAASLHAKAVVIDREHALVGSMNLDPRSRVHNTEVAVLLESPELAGGIGRFFDEAIQPQRAFRIVSSADDAARPVWIARDGDAEVRYDREPLTSFWQRLVTEFLGAAIPEHLL
jgi:putative cardiolipin synthase